MKLVKYICTFIVISVLGVFGYYQALGFSAGLPYPEFMNEQLKSSGELSPVLYWGFNTITLTIPYALGAAIVSFFGARISTWWVPVASIVLSLLCIVNLTWSLWYWLSLCFISIFVSVVFALWGRAKNECVGVLKQ